MDLKFLDELRPTRQGARDCCCVSRRRSLSPAISGVNARTSGMSNVWRQVGVLTRGSEEERLAHQHPVNEGANGASGGLHYIDRQAAPLNPTISNVAFYREDVSRGP